MKPIHSIETLPATITKVPCTCGELFQGVVDEEPCLISCPIDIYSTAQVGIKAQQESCSHSSKIARALQLVEQRTGIQVFPHTNCPLPAGRGYGTSTADIGAILYCINHSFNPGWSAEEIAGMAVQIEPSDSTLFPGLTCFHHQTGNHHENLGNAPQAQIIILDPGGIVDSQEYNKTDWYQAHPQLIKQHQHIFQMMKQGIAENDLEAIAQAATLSAVAHQVIACNPFLDFTISLATALGAHGVCRAHSGTILGILFPPHSVSNDILTFIKSRIEDQKVMIRLANLTQGGPIYRPAVQEKLV